MTELIKYYLSLRFDHAQPLISADKCYDAILEEIEANKIRRRKALEKVDLEEKQKQQERAKAKIQARLLQAKEEVKRLEQKYQNLLEQEKGKAPAIQNRTAQIEPVETESLQVPTIIIEEPSETEEKRQEENEELGSQNWNTGDLTELINSEPPEPNSDEEAEELARQSEGFRFLMDVVAYSSIPSYRQGESSTQAQRRRHNWPILRRLITIKDYYKRYPGVPVERMPPLRCGCRPLDLKNAFGEHNKTFNPILKQPFHCCVCKRPGNTMHISTGNEEYYQWCSKCEKEETYDVTEEEWYGKPCHVCERPMVQKVNIDWNFDVCTTICKYAYLAVHTSNNFTHIPTRIKHYIETKGCREHYLDVAVTAERYYKRRHPYERLEYNRTQYANQLSWTQMAREFSRDLNRQWNTTEVIFLGETVEAEVLRQSFEDHNRLLTERFTEMRDLRTDGRLGDKIRLCDECLMPYTIEELKEDHGKWLCIKTETNPNPCEEENSPEQGLNTTTQPIEIPERPPSRNNIDPWEQ